MRPKTIIYPELAHDIRDGLDPLVVWKLDRLGQSTKDILAVADDLSAAVSVCASLTGTLAATDSPTGRGSSYSR